MDSGYENISTGFFVNYVGIRKLQDCNQHPLEAMSCLLAARTLPLPRFELLS